MQSVPLCGRMELSWEEGLSTSTVKKTGCTVCWDGYGRFQREHGSVQAKSRWAYAKRLNIELGRKIAGAVTKYAKENHADIIVFEYLEIKGKISGKKKQKLHLWRKRDIQKRCEHQAHRNRMNILLLSGIQGSISTWFSFAYFLTSTIFLRKIQKTEYP